MFDGKAFGIEVVAVVKAHMEKTLAPLLAQLDAMRKEIDALKNAPAPKDGKDADVDEIAALAAAALLPDIMAVRGMVEALPAPVELPDISAMIADAVKAIPVPKDGKDADQEAIAEAVATIITDNMRKDFEELRADLDGIIPKLDDLNGRIGEEIVAVADHHFGPPDHTENLIKSMIADAIAALPPAEKGKDADPELVASLVTQEAERILASWERPQDGKDGAPGEKGADGLNGKDGVDGKDGRDGLDVVKFIRDDRGHLNGILRDGTTVDLGEYVGKDGAPGERGKDGADAVGFDDMDLVETEQGIFLRFTRGDVVKDFRLPVVVDRGVFKEGTEYHKGDGVTWGGSFWIAQDTTADKPDSGKGWRLSVKRGRDGKDGTMKTPPKPGPVKVG